MNIIEKLNRLYGVKVELYSTCKKEQESIADHKSRIIELERKIHENTINLHEEIYRLEKEIETETLEKGATQKADYLQAIYTKAPKTFDPKKFKAERPTLYEYFVKVGEPRIRITAV